MATPKPPLQISSYTVLPITFPPLPSFPRKATHYLYLRPHEPKQPSPTSHRSLFAVNIPTDSTPSHFRALFSQQLSSGGNLPLERVDFESTPTTTPTTTTTTTTTHTPGRRRPKKRKLSSSTTTDDANDSLVLNLPATWDRQLHRSGSTAVLVFADQHTRDAALTAAQRAAQQGVELAWGAALPPGNVRPLGSHRYLTHSALLRPDRSTLEAAVQSYMTSLSAREAAAATASARARSAPDEDGFVTVTRGAARTGPARREDAEAKGAAAREKERKRAEGMGDFYRFQTRERNKAARRELVGRFELDRKRVEEMRKRKGGGRFRPAE